MANYQYTMDIIADVRHRAGEPATGGSYGDDILRYINRAQQTIALGGKEYLDGENADWWWLYPSPGVLTLLPKMTAGTVGVTEDSTTITFTDAPDPDTTGYFIKFGSNDDIYRISDHSAMSNGAVLDSPFNGVTNTADTYELVKLEYTLPSDLIRLNTDINLYGDRHKISGITVEKLERDWPLPPFQEGDPVNFAFVGERTIRFSHSVTEKTRADFMYLQMPADLTNVISTEEPSIPLLYRHILSDLATFNIMLDKSDSRADGVGLQARNGMKAMLTEHKKRMRRQSSKFATIDYRQRQVNSKLLRTESGIILRP